MTILEFEVEMTSYLDVFLRHMYGKRFLSMRYPPPHRIVYDGWIDLNLNFYNVLGGSG